MKNKSLLFLSFILLTLGLYAQEENHIDANGNKQGIWKKYYDSGRLRYEGAFKDDKEIGIFKFYDNSDNRHPVVIRKFEQGSALVHSTFYTNKGDIVSEGYYKGKNKEGKWVYFHKGGKSLMTIEHYKDGILDGERIVFYKNGKITIQERYVDGKLDGNSKKFTNEGVLIEDINYSKGKLHGIAKYYEITGQLYVKGVYKENLKVGYWEIYENGELKEKLKAEDFELPDAE